MYVSQSLKRQLKSRYSLALLVLFTIIVLDAVSTSLILSLLKGTSEANTAIAWIITKTDVTMAMMVKIAYSLILVLSMYHYRYIVSHKLIWIGIGAYILVYSVCTLYQF
jgi:hypothetical protein